MTGTTGSGRAASTGLGPAWQVAAPRPNRLGESPFWHPHEQRLYWVDIPAMQLHRCDTVGGQTESWQMPSEPGCIAPAASGGLVIALRDGIYRARAWGDALVLIARFSHDPRTTRFNDGKADPVGRLWAGTMYEPRDERKAELYSVDCRPDNGQQGHPVIECKARDAITANGIAWSPDCKTVYWTDTPSHAIQAWDWDAGSNEMSNHRIFQQFPTKPTGWQPGDAGYLGRPDGAAVDEAGNYWCAMYEGGRVLQFSPAGELLRDIPLPAMCPTMPCFGGRDLKTLFVTTASDRRPAQELEQFPQSGHVLSQRVDVAGLPVNFFADQGDERSGDTAAARRLTIPAMDPALTPLCDRIRAASSSGTALRIRGGGTKDFYGEPPQGELLDTRGLTGITAYEPSELVVTVRAGTPLAELEALLASKGQCLPFEAPHFGAGATVGGMVAAGLSGPARASVGSVRDYVLGITMLNGRGELLTFGGTVMKNVAGYDVSRLAAGSLGTLGLIVEVSLKVLPMAPAEATLKFALPQADALRQLNLWGGQPLPLNASCWVEDAGVGTLFLRLRGALAAVEAACRKLGGERQDNALVAPDWNLCREQRLPWFLERGERELWRLSLPQSAPVLELHEEPPLVEWHGGQRWLRIARGQGERLRQAAKAVGGHATLFRAVDGAGAATTKRFQPLDPVLLRIHRELKREFDPTGIFNRGRLYPDF